MGLLSLLSTWGVQTINPLGIFSLIGKLGKGKLRDHSDRLRHHLGLVQGWSRYVEGVLGISLFANKKRLSFFKLSLYNSFQFNKYVLFRLSFYYLVSICRFLVFFFFVCLFSCFENVGAPILKTLQTSDAQICKT